MAKGIDKRSKYTPETDDLVKGFALLGYTNKEIAKELEVTERTFYNWLKIYPSLFQSLKEARIPPDIEVAGAFITMLQGMEHKYGLALKKLSFDEMMKLHHNKHNKMIS